MADWPALFHLAGEGKDLCDEESRGTAELIACRGRAGCFAIAKQKSEGTGTPLSMQRWAKTSRLQLQLMFCTQSLYPMEVFPYR